MAGAAGLGRAGFSRDLSLKPLSPAKAGVQFEPLTQSVLARSEGASSPNASAGSGPRLSPGRAELKPMDLARIIAA
ncbi:hypothetical protein DBR21_15400 [Caulobacter sp. HMWF009]|nr:hypothetical protein DBR21_15400 [Caulobacter sp. HMWF009]PTT10633.1 hypothetical protein DBR10_04985 [Caulobacter sp. HMWF025]